MKFKFWIDVVKDSCIKAKQLGSDYYERLTYEHKEIIKQGANEYWTDLINNENKFNHNDNGLVLPFLYGITDIDPIKGIKKLYINGDQKIDGIEIVLENGNIINTSEDSLIKTKRGYIKAKDLETNDEIC